MQKKVYRAITKIRMLLESSAKAKLINEICKLPYRDAINTEKRDCCIIVSIASYKDRYNQIGQCIKSLMYQTMKPDQIIVWLDEQSDENALTHEMKLLQDSFGINFMYTNDELRSHKKYFYALNKYSDKIIITADDDLVYPCDFIESLYKYHLLYPDSVCARRVHKIRFSKYGKILPYNEWLYEYHRKGLPSFDLCATGGAGALYPPHIFDNNPYIFDKKLIKEMAMTADDLWLKYMEVLSGVTTVWVPNKMIMPPEIEGSQNNALNYINTWHSGNDECLQKLDIRFPEVKKRLAE